MKAAVFCLVFCSIVMTTLSQLTNDLEQQPFCDDDYCQQQILTTLRDQFTAQFTAMKNEISRLNERFDNFLQKFNVHSETTVDDTMLPVDYPSSPSWYINH